MNRFLLTIAADLPASSPNPVIAFATIFAVVSVVVVSVYLLIKLGNASPEAGLILSIVLAIILFPLTIYFLPSIIAWKRKHRNFLALFVLNACLAPVCGIGWVVALVWACLNEPTPVVVQGLPNS
jgi:uncharacterized membrane protein YagU involved in acid resistance